MCRILQHLKNGEQLLQYTVPVLVARLGQPDIFEPSEELRLELIKLISLTLKDFKASMSPYVGDLVLVLRQTLQDPYPEVKKVCGVCIVFELCGCHGDPILLSGKGKIRFLLSGSLYVPLKYIIWMTLIIL